MTDAQADKVVVTILADNCCDMSLPSTATACRTATAGSEANHLFVGALPSALTAEPGFSALLDVYVAGARTRILYDTGMTPGAVVRNAALLGIDLTTVNAVVISHGHFDHTAGLSGLGPILGARHVPLLLHPGCWAARRFNRPGEAATELPQLRRDALEGAGFSIVESTEPRPLAGGAAYLSGQVTRTVDFERGLPHHEQLVGGTWVPDPLILDDQGMLVRVRDRGLVILTGCGHCGVMNLVHHAISMTGSDQVVAVLGGFHLNGDAFAAAITPTTEALVGLGAELVAASHCTGDAARVALARALGGAFATSAVGTRFSIGDSP